MNYNQLNDDEKVIVLKINGEEKLRSFLLLNGITIGTVFTINYSPNYAKLINIGIGAKMVCLRLNDFEKIEWVKLVGL